MLASIDENGSYNVLITTSLTTDVNNCIELNEETAIIYDIDSIYAYSNHEVIKLRDSAIPVTYRDELDYDLLSSISIVRLAPSNELTITVSPLMSRIASSITLSVSKIAQDTNSSAGDVVLLVWAIISKGNQRLDTIF